MMSTIDTSLAPEVRIKALVDKATIEINLSIKAIRYIRTGKELMRSAQNYYEDGLLDSAYVLYMRFLILSLEQVKEHPGFKELGDDDIKEMRANCKRVLPMAEKIKSELLVKYQAEYEAYNKALKFREEEKQEAERRAKLEQAKSIAAASMAFSSGISHQGIVPSGPPIEPSLISRNDGNPSAATSTIRSVNYEYGTNDNISNGTKIINPSNNSQHPQFDRRSKPSRLMSPMGTDSLRTVIIPGDLISKFTSIASLNSLKNIETCGVLCGKIIRDELVITHLVLPKQTGTPDSCTTLNEEEIYNIIDRYSLIQMGWIHTHPSQTSFLSSVDLHMHLSYQLMMPESIAIVVAPSKQECNVFTLTSVGVEMLQKCVNTGFHPHPPLEEPYFVDANHTAFESSRYIIVEDLR